MNGYLNFQGFKSTQKTECGCLPATGSIYKVLNFLCPYQVVNLELLPPKVGLERMRLQTPKKPMWPAHGMMVMSMSRPS